MVDVSETSCSDPLALVVIFRPFRFASRSLCNEKLSTERTISYFQRLSNDRFSRESRKMYTKDVQLVTIRGRSDTHGHSPYELLSVSV